MVRTPSVNVQQMLEVIIGDKHPVLKCFCFSESVDQVVEKYGLQKITLLREISVKTGIQVRFFYFTKSFNPSL